MSVFVLALLAFLVALGVSSAGFLRVVYFISTGYGFSVSAIALMVLLLVGNHLPVPSLVQLVLLVVYGVRLGWYILRRENLAQYAQEQREVADREQAVSGWVKGAIWVSVSLLYVLMTLPAVAAAGSEGALPSPADGSVAFVGSVVGLVLLAGGLGLETLADFQKNRFKKDHPQDFCAVGVFRWVRCPNYLGEVLVWIGNFVAALGFLSPWYLWAPSLVGLGCIVLIMMGSTKRLEAKQEERYGTRADYQVYIRQVPVLVPWVPVYSLKNVRVFLE